jgi:2-keto-4-pentenoate hydratase
MTEVDREFAQRLMAAHQARRPMPLFVDEKLPTLVRGYEVQRAYVDLLLAPTEGSSNRARSRQIQGFKAALTNVPAQQSMGLKAPTGGVLLSDCEYQAPCQIRLADYCRPIIETEIGYRVSRVVTDPVTLENLNDYIDFALPMVEIADAGYATPNALGRALSGPDLVAANSAAGGYIVGHADCQPLDTNEVAVTLRNGDKVLNHAHGHDALGSQAAVLVWLINHSLAQGYDVLPGYYLMTGSLGRVQLATPGCYVADYSCNTGGIATRFGRIEFEIV